MYDELIFSLRICGKINSANDNCIAFHDGSCEAEPVCMYELMDNAADAIEELSKQHEAQRQSLIALMNERPSWIPVTEQCPEKSGDYLVFDDCRNLYVNEWHCLLKKWQYDDSRITHWQPLPEPPKEET